MNDRNAPDHDETDGRECSERTETANGSTAVGEGGPTHGRRDLLRALAVTGGITTAGCNLFADDSPDTADSTATMTDQPTDDTDSSPTPTETPTPTQTESPTETETPSDPEYEKQEVQIETPWTDEVGPDNARPEYPRPQMVREVWANLNGVWQFAGADEDEDPPIDEALPERVLVPYPIESGLSGIKRYEPWMWYRRTFAVPDEWAVGGEGDSTDRLLLHFERVDWEATVYVNGEEVTTHRGGYDHFAADVTEYLTDEGPQELVVGVYDPTGLEEEPLGHQPKGRQGVAGGVTGLWKSSASGIWDTVWLEPVPETYVAGLDMTPDLADETLQLAVETGGSTGAGDATVEATAHEDGTEVGSVSGSADEELELPVPEPHTWSPGDPFLYDLEVRLLVDGNVVDEVASYFGMRSLCKREINGIARPVLNGEVTYHHGSLDSGYWPDGVYTAPTDEAQRFQLEALRDLGFNMVRLHSKLETRRWFAHTDGVGLLVWADIPNMDEELPDDGNEPHPPEAREHFKTEVEQMVTELDTHPSMAVWIAFNEGWGFANHNLEFVRDVTAFIADLDPERYVDANSGHDVGSNIDSGAGDITDVHEYPGLQTPTPEHDRFSALGEYTTTSMHIPEHTFGRCGGTQNGEIFVRDYVDSIEALGELLVTDGLSASVYTATTDLFGVCNGQITYDRKVVKPERAENGVERVREAHEDLYRTMTLLEHAALDLEAPVAYDPSQVEASADPFEVTATIANPESVSSLATWTEAIELELWGVPDDWSASSDGTGVGSLADGESTAVTWEVSPETAEGAVELGVTASFRVDGETHELTVSRDLREMTIASWGFNGTDEDSVSGYTASLEGGADFDGDVAVEGSHSLGLDGESGYALLAEFDGPPEVFHASFRRRTLATWIRPDATDGRQVVYNEGGTVNGFGLRVDDGTLEASVANGGVVESVTSPFDRTGEWTHVAAVFDDGALRLFVDGEQVAGASDLEYDVVPSHIAGAEFGGSTTSTLWDDGDDNFFGGNVDLTSIYREALDAGKIASLADQF